MLSYQAMAPLHLSTEDKDPPEIPAQPTHLQTVWPEGITAWLWPAGIPTEAGKTKKKGIPTASEDFSK